MERISLQERHETKKKECGWNCWSPFYMIAVMVTVILILGACTPMPTLQELEDEALITGDWSLVEAREKRINRNNEYKAAVAFCRERHRLLYCETRSGRIKLDDCYCATKRAVRARVLGPKW